MADKALPTADTTLHELLKMGATITFGERKMRGDPSDGYIHVANEFDGLGVWDLDTKDGVNSAVNDLANDARDAGYDLFGQSLPEGPRE